MSLRNDIHTAFDEIAPLAGGMPERVVRSAASSPARAGRAWRRVRVPLAMVASLLLVALAVGALAGGRVYRDWSSFFNRPAQAGGLAALEARPLHLPVVAAGEPCPSGPNATLTGVGDGRAFGDGPVFGMPIAPDSDTAWGTYGFQWLLTQRGLTGLVLGRGRDLITGGSVVFVGTFASGPTSGEDRDKNGFVIKQHREVVLDTSNPPADTNPPEVYFQGSENYVAWQVNVGLPAGSSGCVAFQFDGPGFSEVFVSPPAS